jgi:hypothetical protein
VIAWREDYLWRGTGELPLNTRHKFYEEAFRERILVRGAGKGNITWYGDDAACDFGIEPTKSRNDLIHSEKDWVIGVSDVDVTDLENRSYHLFVTVAARYSSWRFTYEQAS